MDTFKGDETLGGGLDFDLGLVRRDLGDDFDQVFQKAVCRRFLVSDSSFGPTASLLIRSAGIRRGTRVRRPFAGLPTLEPTVVA